MAETLGTGPQRMRVGGLARRFRATGSQEDLDNLKAGIEEFEEEAAAAQALAEHEQAAAEKQVGQQPEQPELPDAHIGSTEGDDTQTA